MLCALPVTFSSGAVLYQRTDSCQLLSRVIVHRRRRSRPHHEVAARDIALRVGERGNARQARRREIDWKRDGGVGWERLHRRELFDVHAADLIRMHLTPELG